MRLFAIGEEEKIMNFNRKSGKKATNASLVIAITMVVALVVTVQTQGIPADYMIENGAQACKAGLIDLFTKILW